MTNLSPISIANAIPVSLHTVVAKPSISVVGLGYVGAVSTACLSSLGHRVVGVDVDPHKVAEIATGKSPIHEKGLERLLSRGVDEGLVTATGDLAAAVEETDVTFVSVGTPTASDGSCDYRYIQAAAQVMGEGLARKSQFHHFVMRCSVPPGTTMGVMMPIIEAVSGRKLGEDFGVAFNPEFLREGVAVDDFYAPPKTVIGATCDRTAEMLKQIYAPIDEAAFVTSIETAEMVKYVDNVWHATKVCFANEVGRLAKSLGVDSHDVMDVFCQDHKLNLSPYYLKPGFAYGGSCLPKEVRAVAHIAKMAGIGIPMIESLGVSNQAQIDEAIEMVRATGAKRVGILGIAFKPGTDDLRESPILEVMAALRADGIEVMAHDPAITTDTCIEAQLEYVKHGSAGLATLAEELPGLLVENAGDVAEQAEAIIVTQRNQLYATLAGWAMEHGQTPVIDVVRLFEDLPEFQEYQGIGW